MMLGELVGRQVAVSVKIKIFKRRRVLRVLHLAAFRDSRSHPLRTELVEFLRGHCIIGIGVNVCIGRTFVFVMFGVLFGNSG